ncbi:MAG TPA: hypothetical protein VFW03_19765 [Gemmatimonadaceae bacterium]|nr:hypothetical protein [Gemmatimonadaceae bacterium]
MSHRSVLTRAARSALCAWCVSGGACTAVVSLEPTIEPDSAVRVPALVGDWVTVDREDPIVARVAPGREAATYSIRFGDSVALGTAVGRPTLSARLVRRPGGYLGEAVPESSDGLLDTLSTRYGSMIRPMYMVAAVKFVGDDLQVAGLLGGVVRVVLAAGVCPLPGTVIDEPGELVFTGRSRQLRRTTDCLLTTPGVLDEWIVFRRRQIAYRSSVPNALRATR